MTPEQMNALDRALAEKLMGWELHKDYTWWRKEKTTATLPDGSPVYAEYYTGYLAPGANPLVNLPETKGFWHPIRLLLSIIDQTSLEPLRANSIGGKFAGIFDPSATSEHSK